MDVKKVRELFPHIRKGITYFNHAATGAFSTRVLDVVSEFFRERSEDNIDDYPDFVKVNEETKEKIASMINTHSSRIAFADNTTNGFNILAQGLSLKKGDEIILNDIEFPANVYPFLNLQKKGVKVVFAKSHDGIVSAEDIIEKINPHTRVVSVSMVQFLTGYRIDLNLLGETCRANNVFLSVDAIQGLGALNLDVEKSNIDFVSCGSQKWLLGIQGLSFIYVSEKLQQEIQPAYVGWLGVENAWEMLDYKLSLKDSAERFQPGTLNTVGIYALNASLNLFRDFGFSDVEKRVLSNAEYLINKLMELDLKPVTANLNSQFLSGIVSLNIRMPTLLLKFLKIIRSKLQ